MNIHDKSYITQMSAKLAYVLGFCKKETRSMFIKPELINFFNALAGFATWGVLPDDKNILTHNLGHLDVIYEFKSNGTFHSPQYKSYYEGEFSLPPHEYLWVGLRRSNSFKPNKIFMMPGMGDKQQIHSIEFLQKAEKKEISEIIALFNLSAFDETKRERVSSRIRFNANYQDNNVSELYLNDEIISPENGKFIL